MENNQESEIRKESHWEDRAPSAATRWLVIVSVLLFAGVIFAGGYAYERSETAASLTDQNLMMRGTETQMRGQIDMLTAKINQMAAQQPVAAPGAAPSPDNAAPTSGKIAVKRPASASSTSAERRIRQMQSQLAAQQKELDKTQGDIAGARTDLEGQLGSTRDELNGSIARNHGELVTLEKKGERSYTEFDLSKSREFQHEGPIQISLRKADSKHQSYDLMMLVNDHQLSKKKVDLYEPIWLHDAGEPQPVQIVVNQIDKNHIHGYISAPKYRESELTSSAASPSTDGNTKSISDSTADSSSYSTSHSTSVPATPSQAQPRPVD